MEPRSEGTKQQPKKNGAPAQEQQKPQTTPLEKPLQGQTALSPRSRFDILRDQIAAKMESIAEALPEHLRKPEIVKRWERVIVSTVARTPKLQECAATPQGIASLLQAIQQAAQLGLEPTGVLGSAYLVPFRTGNKDKTGRKTEGFHMEAQLIVGYRGLIDLARRSNQIESIEARVVYSNDRFHARFGTATEIEHEPAWEGERGAIKAFYAVAKLKGGQTQIEIMTKAEVDAIRGRSKSGQDGPWVTDYPEMGRKTVVRRIAKYLPLTPEMADAFATDNDLEEEPQQDAQPQAKGTAGLAAIVKAKTATVEAEHVETAAEEETPHDAETGEVHETTGEQQPDTSGVPSEEEQAEIRAAEAAQATGKE
jgi:recombination protein RecT